MSALVCLALGAVSLLVPSQPTTDPWGWIVWGHELMTGGFTTVMGGAPSWKPFPVLITTPLALAGSVAPTFWLLVARAGSLYSLVVAWRLGDRLAGPVAGVLAAAGLVLSTDWVRSFAHGYSEPLAIGFLLAAVDGHLQGHRRRALLLGAAAALIRPEALPLLAIYALALVRRRQASWVLGAAVPVAVAALWLVPDWIGSGIPLHGGELAKDIVEHGPGADWRAISRGALIAPLPLTICALAALGLADDRRRAAVRGIAGLAAAWAALVAALLLAGYPPVARFFVLPAALVAVLGAVGAALVLERPRARGLAPAVAAALVVALVVRGTEAADQGIESVRRSQLQQDLSTAIARAGPELGRCGTPLLPRGLGWARGRVAYDLGLRPLRVRSARTSAARYVDALARSEDERLPPRPRPRVVRVVLPDRPFVLLDPFGGARVRVAPPGQRLRELASAGVWRVLAPSRDRSCRAA
jgi:hypothetical protein